MKAKQKAPKKDEAELREKVSKVVKQLLQSSPLKLRKHIEVKKLSSVDLGVVARTEEINQSVYLNSSYKSFMPERKKSNSGWFLRGSHDCTLHESSNEFRMDMASQRVLGNPRP